MEPIYPDLSKELAQHQNSAIKVPQIIVATQTDASYISQAASAPPGEVHIVERSVQTYRLEHISEIQKQLQLERYKREQLAKKYKKASASINVVDNVLVVSSLGMGVAGIGLLSTIIAAPLTIALEGASVCVGLLSVIGSHVVKKLNKKAEKHNNIKVLADSKINTISSHISKALNDGEISDDEFKLILDELDKFNQMKKEIRLKITAELDAETKQSLIDQGRQQMQEKFEKMIVK